MEAGMASGKTPRLIVDADTAEREVERRRALKVDHKALVTNMTDKRVVELCLPAHMLALVTEALEKREGITLRRDVSKNLSMGLAAIFEHLSVSRRRAVAEVLDRDARRAYSGAAIYDLRLGLAATSVVCYNLLIRGVYADPSNAGVMAAVLIYNEVSDYPEEWGSPTLLEINSAAGRIWRNLRDMGYFGVKVLSDETIEEAVGPDG